MIDIEKTERPGELNKPELVGRSVEANTRLWSNFESVISMFHGKMNFPTDIA